MAVQSSVWPLLSTRILSVVLRRWTCPGALNLSPICLRISSTGASWKMVSAYWVMVSARSSSVMPVYVSRWLMVMPKEDFVLSYGMSVGAMALRSGYLPTSSQKTSDMNGSPISSASLPGVVVQTRPPASCLIVLSVDAVTNWDATVMSVSRSLSSKS